MQKSQIILNNPALIPQKNTDMHYKIGFFGHTV